MRHSVELQKLLNNLSSEGVPCSTRTQHEFVSVGIRIAPHEVCHGALVGNLSKAVDDFYLVD